MQKVLEAVTKFTRLRYMQVLMNGFMGMSAITICGSLFTLLKSIPFGPWTTFLATSGLGEILSIPVSITTDVIAIYVVISMAYNLAKSFDMEGFSPALVALGSFLLLTPYNTVVYNADYTVATPVSGVIPLGPIGTQGMFLGIIVGMLAARIYIFLIQKGFKIKMPDSVPENVSKMFEALIPGGLTFVVFLAIRYGMSLTAFGTAQAFIYKMLQAPLATVGGGLGGLIVYMTVGNLLWLFGIHGGMVAYVGMAPIITLMMTENTVAFAAGVAVPHPEWAMGMGFLIIGGGGATLALNLWMVTKLTKSEQFKTLGKLALPTSLFNINEPLIFGTPIIMNPYLAVPFVVTPLINLVLSLIAFNIGFFVPTGAGINTFMPVGVYGALLTGSWQGFAMTLILIAVDLVIWFPFYKAADNANYKAEQEQAAQLEQAQA